MDAVLPQLPKVASAFGAIFVGFGLNAIFNTRNAMTFFELQYPNTKKEQQAVDLLSIVYGVRDIFMGVAICASAHYGSREALGWITVSAGVVAAVDGVACKMLVGKGQMNHWGYAPLLVALGGVLLAL